MESRGLGVRTGALGPGICGEPTHRDDVTRSAMRTSGPEWAGPLYREEFLTMDLVKGLGYVALTVPEIDRSLDFYRRIAHLKVSERGKKKAFLTGGINH